MHSYLRIRHRALVKAYLRYMAADRAWKAAAREALLWLPERTRRDTLPIGDPGSRVRKAHDRREAALDNFTVARRKLDAARARLNAAQPGRRVLLLGYMAV